MMWSRSSSIILRRRFSFHAPPSTPCAISSKSWAAKYPKIATPQRTIRIVSASALMPCGVVSRPVSDAVTIVRYSAACHVSPSVHMKRSVPPAKRATIAVTIRSASLRVNPSSMPTLVSSAHGRRAFGAPAQHPHGSGAPRRRLRQLRQYHLLRLRVHADVRADRPRGRGRRRSGRRSHARQHVAAVHEGAARGDAGRVFEVHGGQGDPGPPRDERPSLARALPPALSHRDALHEGRVVLEPEVVEERRVRLLEARPAEALEEARARGRVARGV